jgi:uncharacterized protein
MYVCGSGAWLVDLRANWGLYSAAPVLSESSSFRFPFVAIRESVLTSLSEQLTIDLKQAMLDKDTRRRDVIRYLRAAITNAEIEKRAPLTDDEIQAVVRNQIKQRRDSIEMFRKGGRPELAEEEEAQIAILQTYLPAQLDPAQLEAIVRRVADELDVQSPRDMSRLMPALLQATEGRAEGRVLSQLARQELERRSGGQG